MADQREFWPTVSDTAPEKLGAMSDETLEACYRYFVDISPTVAHLRQEFQAAIGRTNLLFAEKQRRILATQHAENVGIGKKTLGWAKVAGIAGIATVVLTAGLLILDIPFSKLLPSTSSQASPASSPKMTRTASPSEPPLATETPSATPLESATPSTEATPP